MPQPCITYTISQLVWGAALTWCTLALAQVKELLSAFNACRNKSSSSSAGVRQGTSSVAAAFGSSDSDSNGCRAQPAIGAPRQT